MKSKNYIIFAFTILLFGLGACNDECLDKEPLNIISASQVYEDEQLANSFLYNIYGRLSYRDFATYWMIASATDESRSKSGWIPTNTVIVPGLITPTNNPMGIWSGSYKTIRYCNSLIAEMEQSELDEDFTTQIIGEARFLRAYTYFELVKSYGGVPLIKVAQGLEDELLVHF